MALNLLPTGAAEVQGAQGGAAAAALITVPAGKFWKPASIYMVWQPSATVGTRIALLTIKDAAGNVVSELLQVPTFTAADASLNFTLTPQAPQAAAFTTAGSAKYATGPIPDITLPPGFTITPSDVAAIDASGDVVNLTMQYSQYEALER